MQKASKSHEYFTRREISPNEGISMTYDFSFEKWHSSEFITQLKKNIFFLIPLTSSAWSFPLELLAHWNGLPCLPLFMPQFGLPWPDSSRLGLPDGLWPPPAPVSVQLNMSLKSFMPSISSGMSSFNAPNSSSSPRSGSCCCSWKWDWGGDKKNQNF